MRYQDFYQLAGDELRPDATAHGTLAIRADQTFAPRNSMLNADTRFPGFVTRIKEDQCSYTNHQNDVTYYNMVNQHKIQNFQFYNKVSLPLSFTKPPKTMGILTKWTTTVSVSKASNIELDCDTLSNIPYDIWRNPILLKLKPIGLSLWCSSLWIVIPNICHRLLSPTGDRTFHSR